jgi:hypothetical protein
MKNYQRNMDDLVQRIKSYSDESQHAEKVMMKPQQYESFKGEINILINKTLSMETEYNRIKDIIDKI